MAPKRSASPPPPPPPVASSEETSSASDSDESEEEEEALAALPAPVVSNKGEESESEEEEESEEEGEDMVRSSATQKRAPLPQNREEDESSGDEEEGESSDSDKAPPPLNPAPKQGAGAAEGNGSKILSPKRQAFQRIWSTEDEVRVLEALAAHRREHGALPQIDALVSTLAGSLDHPGVGINGLRGKIKTLKRRYDAAAKKKSGDLPSSNGHDRRIFDLSKSVWGSSDTAAGREFGEMCELYPHLAEEVKALEAAHPGLFKRDFGRLDDDKARALDMKVKKQRIAEITLELRRRDLTKEVTKVLAELIQ